MFDSIRIKNFRSINDTGDLNLADLNILVGPNNSGKSSILYALMLMKMSLSSMDVRSVLTTSTSELDLGSYLDLIRAGNTNLNLSICFSLDKQAINKQSLFEQKRSGKKQKSYAGCNVSFFYDLAKNQVGVKSFSGADLSNQLILSVNRTKQNGWKIKGLSKGLSKHVDIGFTNFLPIIWPLGPKPKNKNFVQEIIEWHYNWLQDTGDIQYTNIEQGNPGNGGYIYYEKTNNTPFNAGYDVFNSGMNNLTEMEWDRTAYDGRVRDPLHFGDNDWHCWDMNLMDTTCQ